MGFVETRRTDGRHNEEGAPDILYVWRGESVGVERTASAQPARSGGYRRCERALLTRW
jgi:hypothetical protein